MQDLKGKVALVTGASRGIGRHIALQLAQRGADVAINYRSRQPEGDEVAREIEATGVRALAFKADLSKMPEARSLVRQVQDEWGRIDILVNNAGITKDKSMKKLTDDDWNDVLDTNLGSVYATCSEVLKIMMDQKYGRIINITSFVGQAGNFGQANYAASKGGIIAFTKTLALEMAKYNITVNAIAPGFTETEMLAQVPENIREQIIARVPMGRFGKPEEIARAVVFLAAEGDYITGQQINVNGGVYM
ncbi:3-oxoacyl-[acyl-carrier-protein] reductase [Marinobacter sp. DSM 26671]|jgi:acetoacetyl-CoA reductase|uniref:3-oxoacyl-[acyl-carrier-protein] reductase n=1 Tax=Marinobacter flavimaris TaxID=262076 RepID=A0A3D8H2F0_9GAMM|nr:MULTISPECIES: 3-oxoacyl-[acyl-carrier-protein] reductase [Marinobacter]MCP4064263.1 3-oxoacyl-[acyl-carrier-protein] reductase [Gammaproteobacteria bacterium]MEC7727643.1 3-oxoacyl-[acyl-carrier-protein] reductase [Pseudomonadota bacterium]PTB93215.1 3-oxoacyl-[acyl-carrier-protein] reductase [Marinobacter sp. B9-2]AKV95434.1 3-oxoacyl-ACP synthase [Marinobacter sp. CP1]MAK47904.1 3-oxoacyl-[acyl-carrier-protein] reductase [Marinobacter sp.]|tara:strand:- start:31 stop:774 length:744 start_codon:yes stop_codon:yes gene_type:complete